MMVLTMADLLALVEEIAGRAVVVEVLDNAGGEVNLRLSVAWWRRPWYRARRREEIRRELLRVCLPQMPISASLTVCWA